MVESHIYVTGSVKTLMFALAKSSISADLESVISTISSIVNLHDQQKVLHQSKPVEIISMEAVIMHNY